MQFDYFPHQYEPYRKSKAQEEVKKELERCTYRQKSIDYNIGEKAQIGNYTRAGFILGGITGFFACYGLATIGEPIALLVFPGITILGAGVGLVVALGVNAGYSNRVENAKNEIAREKACCDKNIQEIHIQAEKDIIAYKNKFETEAQLMSVNYAESVLATEVIDWMTKGFCKTIDAADRRCHIEKINVPFTFMVYTDKITCNLGTYDFKIKRCANLTSPLQQAALARAIATAIQLNTTMKYPEDASGTNFVLNIAYEYNGVYEKKIDQTYAKMGIYGTYEECKESYVSASIVYTAPNGNYQEVQEW